MLRPQCPNCGMNMIAVSPLRDDAQEVECLRCNHKDTHRHGDAIGAARRVFNTDAAKVKRYRDKATEALQLADLAQTEFRRETLIRIAADYQRIAELYTSLARPAGVPRTPK